MHPLLIHIVVQLLIGAFAFLAAAAPVPSPLESELAINLRRHPGEAVLLVGNAPASRSLALEHHWRGNRCRWTLRNQGDQPVRVSEVVLFDLGHGLAPDTAVYGEGFQMLSQTAGTLAKPQDVGSYTDRGHYRLPEPAGFRTVYGLLRMAPAGALSTLLGFSSCHRFNGKFQFNGERLRVVLETEGLELAAKSSWELEELVVLCGKDRDALYDGLSSAISRNHRRLKHDPVPTGWCSWYWFGPRVTAQDITSNLEWSAKHLPSLRYIQIDDGYQPWMGDWLDSGKAFGGDVRGILRQIKQRGFEPAIWVAPFIASEQSRLFRDHPDWFVKDDQGKPLRSDKVGFGGWRLGPWYALDGTHPAAQKWLEQLFRTLRKEWGCTYFKLDATYWATLPGGHRHDPHATRIEAYRRGMEAIRRGAGNSLLMGCNHPIWPSLGLIHASRSSLDIERSWASFSSIGRENLLRGWQNGRLWWNDPDCVVLHDAGSADIMDAGGKPVTVGKVPDHEYQFHATLIYATGGMVLNGDDLTKLTPRRVEMLRRLVPPTGKCARFADDRFESGITHLKGREMHSLFNWGDQPTTRIIRLDRPARLTDYWTGADLGVHTGEYRIDALAGHSARLIEVRPIQ